MSCRKCRNHKHKIQKETDCPNCNEIEITLTKHSPSIVVLDLQQFMQNYVKKKVDKKLRKNTCSTNTPDIILCPSEKNPKCSLCCQQSQGAECSACCPASQSAAYSSSVYQGGGSCCANLSYCCGQPPAVCYSQDEETGSCPLASVLSKLNKNKCPIHGLSSPNTGDLDPCVCPGSCGNSNLLCVCNKEKRKHMEPISEEPRKLCKRAKKTSHPEDDTGTLKDSTNTYSPFSMKQRNGSACMKTSCRDGSRQAPSAKESIITETEISSKTANTNMEAASSKKKACGRHKVVPLHSEGQQSDFSGPNKSYVSRITDRNSSLTLDGIRSQIVRDYEAKDIRLALLDSIFEEKTAQNTNAFKPKMLADVTSSGFVEIKSIQF